MTITRSNAAPSLTPIQWLICVIAAIGFAFDTYDLLMLPLIVRPALTGLLHVPPTIRSINNWVGLSASTCRRWPAASSACSAAISPTSSAAGACSCGASCSTPSRRWRPATRRRSYQLLFWRCGTFVGVCVEFVAAVAWLAELFPNPKQREAVLGYTQAFWSVGGVMVSARATTWSSPTADHLPRVRGGARGVALHADVGHHPGDSADPDPAVPAGVAGLAGEEGGRHAASGRASPNCSSRSSAGRRSSRR